MNSAADKMALLIGNSAYKGRPLGCPRNDVEAMTDKFRQLNFRTISLVDLTLSQTAKAVEYFCSLLDKEMYAVFYFSGHGVEYNKTTYLMPIDADEPVRIEQCIDSEDFGEKMQKTLAKVIMIFDCCRVRYQIIREHYSIVSIMNLIPRLSCINSVNDWVDFLIVEATNVLYF